MRNYAIGPNGGRSVRVYGIFGWLAVAWVMSACAENPFHLNTTYLDRYADGPVAGLVGIEGGVVSGVINLESSDVGASDRRRRHDEQYHEL